MAETIATTGMRRPGKPIFDLGASSRSNIEKLSNGSIKIKVTTDKSTALELVRQLSNDEVRIEDLRIENPSLEQSLLSHISRDTFYEKDL